MTNHTWSRRGVLGATAAAAGTAVAGSPAFSQAPSAMATRSGAGRARTVAYVGSWTTAERDASGAGLTVYDVTRGSSWTLKQTIAADDADAATPHREGEVPQSPAFMCMDRHQKVLYVVHADTSLVSAFRIDQRSADLRLLNTVNTGGTNPVRVIVDPSNSWVVVANYDDPGSVATFPIRPDGSLGRRVALISLPGAPGPHVHEQQGSYPHSVQFDPSGRWLLVSDRGLDKIFVVRLDASTGALELHDDLTAVVREVSGPRHIVFHSTRPFAYSVDELRSCATAWHWDADRGSLRPLQVWPTTPPEMTGDSRAAEIAIAPTGRFVFASNRSGAGAIDPEQRSDTIGCWSVDQRSGELTPVAWTPTSGLQVRHFTLNRSGSRLYAANQYSNSIVGFAVHPRTGHLREIGRVATTGTPTCIVLNERKGR